MKKDIKFDENIFMYFEEDDFFHQCLKKTKKYILLTILKLIILMVRLMIKL